MIPTDARKQSPKGWSTFIVCLTPQPALLGPQHQPPAPLILTLNRSSLPTMSPEPEPTSRGQTGPEPSASTPTCRKKKFPQVDSDTRLHRQPRHSGTPVFYSLKMPVANFLSGLTSTPLPSRSPASAAPSFSLQVTWSQHPSNSFCFLSREHLSP